MAEVEETFINTEIGNQEVLIDNEGWVFIQLYNTSKKLSIETTRKDEKIAVLDCMIIGEVEEIEGTTLNSLKFEGAFSQFHQNFKDRKLEHFVANQNLLWPNGLVPYDFESGFAAVAKRRITAAMWYWVQSTPIRFIPRSNERDYIVFQPSESKCSSYIGKLPYGQVMRLDPTGSCGIGNVIHELGHALGYVHEHTRPDRDDYVTIQMDAIQESYKHNFDKEFLPTAYGIYSSPEYDYGSIMHYSRTHFSLNKEEKETVIPHQEPFDEYMEAHPHAHMGQRSYLSQMDRLLAHELYGNCTAQDDQDEFLTAAWYTGLWGGCQPACAGSFQHRLVYCGYKKTGHCASEDLCEGPRPESNRTCDLLISSDDPEYQPIIDFGNVLENPEDLSHMTGVLQNIHDNDDFDWFPWAGGDFMAEEISPSAPRTDGSGDENGRFLYYAPSFSYPRGTEGDESWLETPVLNDANENLCKISFKYYIHDGGGTLELQRIYCSCNTKRLWRRSEDSNGWSEKTVELKSNQGYSKLRFVAYAGDGTMGGIGIDDVQFSQGCYWKNQNPLTFEGGTFLADSEICTVPPYQEFWTVTTISAVVGAVTFVFVILPCLIFYRLRYSTVKRRALKRIQSMSLSRRKLMESFRLSSSTSPAPSTKIKTLDATGRSNLQIAPTDCLVDDPPSIDSFYHNPFGEGSPKHQAKENCIDYSDISSVKTEETTSAYPIQAPGVELHLSPRPKSRSNSVMQALNIPRSPYAAFRCESAYAVEENNLWDTPSLPLGGTYDSVHTFSDHNGPSGNQESEAANLEAKDIEAYDGNKAS